MTIKEFYKNEAVLIGFVLFAHILILLYGINRLSISYNEAWIFFNSTSFTHHLVKASTAFFGQNDFALPKKSS